MLPGALRPMLLGFKTDEIQRFVTVDREEGPQRFLLTLDAPTAAEDPEETAETGGALPPLELPEGARKGARMAADYAAFRDTLSAAGLTSHRRYSGGADIAAACGQLAAAPSRQAE